jgi:endonuclease-3
MPRPGADRGAMRSKGANPKERSPKPRLSAGTARQRARVARITSLLEDEFGRPRRSPDPDLVGSLVQTILSQNTTDVNSGRAYLELRERFPHWGEVERASVRTIAAAIRTGGLADVKATRIKMILREIHRETGDLDLDFLRSMATDDIVDYLTHFKGVGAKTAACVALFDLGREVVPVDTHVHRVVGRLGFVGAPGTRDATYEALKPLVPPRRALSLHVNLIRLGRAICRPRSPSCAGCPLRRLCAHARAESS